MNILDLTLTTDANIALFTTGTYDFLQLAYKEGIAASLKENIANYSDGIVYIVQGCNREIVGANYVFREGVIFVGGEFYLMPLTTLIGTSGNIVANLVVTQYTTSYGGDPMEFTVTGPSNAHNIRTSVFAYGSSGSGTLTNSASSDYDNIRIVVSGFEERVSFNGDYINFRRKILTIVYSGSATNSPVVNLDFDESCVGNEVVVNFMPDNGSSIELNSLTEITDSAVLVQDTSVELPTVAISKVTVKYKYLGYSSVTPYTKYYSRTIFAYN